MKYFICALLLLVYAISYAEEDQSFFYKLEFYYDGVARQARGHAHNIFESGLGLGLEFDNDTFRATLNTKNGFSLEGDRYHKKIDYKGELDIEFGYSIPKVWEPIIFTWNEYDKLALIRWQGYLGSGVNITAFENDFITNILTGGLAFNYICYERDPIYNTGRRQDFYLAYLFRDIVIVQPVPGLQLKGIFTFMPIYDFTCINIRVDFGIGVPLFRTVVSGRDMGADFNMVFSADHYTRHLTSAKRTDLILGANISFYM